MNQPICKYTLAGVQAEWDTQTQKTAAYLTTRFVSESHIPRTRADFLSSATHVMFAYPFHPSSPKDREVRSRKRTNKPHLLRSALREKVIRSEAGGRYLFHRDSKWNRLWRSSVLKTRRTIQFNCRFCFCFFFSRDALVAKWYQLYHCWILESESK